MAIDIDQSHYSTGTATVSGVNVTGFGTTFTVLRKGDQWGTHKGFGVRIASITDDTHLTLAYDVPGLQQTAATFEVQRTPYDIGYLQAIEDILRLMGDGALPSLAGVNGTGGDKLIKLIGPKTAVAFDGKRVINIAALTGAGVIEFDALGNASMVPKADLVTGVYADGKANTIAERNTKFGAQAAGFTVLVANIGDGRSAIYFKNTATLNDWSAAAPLTGPVGPTPTITVGTVTTVAPDRPATVTPVEIPGGVRLDFEIPRGPTGDINGVTPFWNTRIGSDTTALAARAGLGLVKQTSETDLTAGALLVNGAYGLGGFVSLASPNLLDTRPTGFYYASSPTGGPAGNGWLRVQSLSNDYQYQEFVAVPGGQKWSNLKDNGVWQGWKAETSAGSVINSWYGAYSLYYSGAAPITVDDNVPPITSGVQLVSIVTGALKSATSKIRIRYSGLVGSETIGAAVLSVHVNGNAAARTSYGVIRTPGDSLFMGGEFEFSPGSGASLTVSLRAAAQTGNLRLNGLTSRLFGGALGHTLVVEEIRA